MDYSFVCGPETRNKSASLRLDPTSTMSHQQGKEAVLLATTTDDPQPQSANVTNASVPSSQPTNQDQKPPQHSTPLITSTNRYLCYLLVVDEWSRYTWVFTFPTKDPPIATVKQFLQQYRNKSGLRQVRTDLGGELAGSAAFRALLRECNFVLETTALELLF